ncbi:MAG: MFS transporter [Burkholderiales bacterium]|nr:MFS transporter [Burkholderiales bacterium]
MNARAEQPGFGATVAALAFAQLLSWAALFYAFSSFVLPMQREFGWSTPDLMGAFTLGLAVCGVASYGVGAAIDRGHGRAVLAGGALLAGAGFAVWSQVTAMWGLYAAWCLLGAAMAMSLYDPAFNVLVKRYPERYRDGITRLTLVGGFASTASFPAVAALIHGWGWRGALLAIGLLLAGVGAPLQAWALRGAAAGHPGAGGAVRAEATLREALREPAFWALTLCFTLYQFVSAALWAHVMPALAAKGFSQAQSLAVLVWFGPAQVGGRLLHALAGRRLPLRPLGIVVLLAIPLSLAIFAFGSSVGALVVFALLLGVANGLVTIVRGAIVPEYFGRSHVGRIGGAMSSVGLISRAAAPLGAAWMLLHVAGYRQVMLLLAALGVASALAFAMARRPVR